jgi:hypothetical protein
MSTCKNKKKYLDIKTRVLNIGKRELERGTGQVFFLLSIFRGDGFV